MEKEFVTYNLSLRMKQLGFDEPCFGYYVSVEVPNPFLVITKISDTQGGYFTFAPLYQQAFRWFREKYNLSNSIDWMSRSSEFYNGYYVHFRGINGNKINQENFIVLNDELPPKGKGYGVYKTYEEAESACIIKLIEIVEQTNAEMTEHGVYK